MERILVADDGSDAALRAVETAAQLAATSGAELIALGVVDLSRFHETDIRALARSEKLDDATAIETLVDSGSRYLDRCQAIAKRAGAARFRAIHRGSDDIAAEIIEVAAGHRVDLIVVGSRGRGRLPGLLLGSVSQKLAAHAPCSVLIAR